MKIVVIIAVTGLLPGFLPRPGSVVEDVLERAGRLWFEGFTDLVVEVNLLTVDVYRQIKHGDLRDRGVHHHAVQLSPPEISHWSESQWRPQSVCSTYMAGRCLITSSSNTGQGAGTKFSEKSHFIVLRCEEGPRVGHFISLLGPMMAFISV